MTTTNLEQLIALVLPLLIAFLKQEHLPNIYNAIIALVIYVIVGVAAVVVSGQQLDINNIVPTVTLFTTEGTVAYHLFWKNLEGTVINGGTGTSS